MIKCMLFTASWCEPCKRIKPLFMDLKKEIDRIEFSVKDVENNQALVQQFGIRSIPTMIITKRDDLQKVVINPASYEQMKQEILAILDREQFVNIHK